MGTEPQRQAVIAISQSHPKDTIGVGVYSFENCVFMLPNSCYSAIRFCTKDKDPTYLKYVSLAQNFKSCVILSPDGNPKQLVVLYGLSHHTEETTSAQTLASCFTGVSDITTSYYTFAGHGS